MLPSTARDLSCVFVHALTVMHVVCLANKEQKKNSTQAFE